MTQAQHRFEKRLYHLETHCKCQALKLPPGPDGRCLVCRKPVAA